MNGSLSEKSTLEELFDFVEPDEGVQVLPVTLNNPDDKKAQLMVVITGEAMAANVIMANVMTAVQDMHETAAQQSFTETQSGVDSEDDDRSSIIVS